MSWALGRNELGQELTVRLVRGPQQSICSNDETAVAFPQLDLLFFRRGPPE